MGMGITLFTLKIQTNRIQQKYTTCRIDFFLQILIIYDKEERKKCEYFGKHIACHNMGAQWLSDSRLSKTH